MRDKSKKINKLFLKNTPYLAVLNIQLYYVRTMEIVRCGVVW